MCTAGAVILHVLQSLLVWQSFSMSKTFNKFSAVAHLYCNPYFNSFLFIQRRLYLVLIYLYSDCTASDQILCVMFMSMNEWSTNSNSAHSSGNLTIYCHLVDTVCLLPWYVYSPALMYLVCVCVFIFEILSRLDFGLIKAGVKYNELWPLKTIKSCLYCIKFTCNYFISGSKRDFQYLLCHQPWHH